MMMCFDMVVMLDTVVAGGVLDMVVVVDTVSAEWCSAPSRLAAHSMWSLCATYIDAAVVGRDMAVVFKTGAAARILKMVGMFGEGTELHGIRSRRKHTRSKPVNRLTAERRSHLKAVYRLTTDSRRKHTRSHLKPVNRLMRIFF